MDVDEILRKDNVKLARRLNLFRALKVSDLRMEIVRLEEIHRSFTMCLDRTSRRIDTIKEAIQNKSVY